MYGTYNLFAKSIGDGYVIEKDTVYSTLSSENLGDFILYGIIDYNYNDNYIVALKIKGSGYSCRDSNKKLFTKLIQYVIINKKTNNVLITTDKNSFMIKKEELNISLKFPAIVISLTGYANSPFSTIKPFAPTE